MLLVSSFGFVLVVLALHRAATRSLTGALFALLVVLIGAPASLYDLGLGLSWLANYLGHSENLAYTMKAGYSRRLAGWLCVYAATVLAATGLHVWGAGMTAVSAAMPAFHSFWDADSAISALAAPPLHSFTPSALWLAFSRLHTSLGIMHHKLQFMLPTPRPPHLRCATRLDQVHLAFLRGETARLHTENVRLLRLSQVHAAMIVQLQAAASENVVHRNWKARVTALEAQVGSLLRDVDAICAERLRAAAETWDVMEDLPRYPGPPSTNVSTRA